MSKLNIRFDEYGMPVELISGDGGDSCNRVGDYASLLYINKLIIDAEITKNNPVRPLHENESLEEYDDYINQRNTAYNEMLVTRGMAAIVDSDLSFHDKLNTLKDHRGNLRRHPTQVPSNNPKNLSRDQMNPIFVALQLFGFSEELKLQRGKLEKGFLYPNVEKDVVGSTKIFPSDYRDVAAPNDINLSYGRQNRFWRNFGDATLLVGVILYTLVSTRLDKDETEDNRILRQLILAKLVKPTCMSKLATKLFFKLRPMNNGSEFRIGSVEGHPVSWYKESYNCNVSAALSWYYRPVWLGRERGDGWMNLWQPVIKWLKE